jgi:cytoskeleton protein RodZ
VGALVLVFLPTIKTIFVGVAPATVSSPSVIFQPESNPDSSAATTTDNGVTTFGPISALPVDTLLTPVVAASAPAAATSSPAAVAGVVFATPAPPVATIANASSAPSASAALTPSAKALLVLTAKTMSWAQVTDAGGQILLSRNLESGEAIGLSGALPLAVIVGRVNAVEVQVRGKPFDLSLYARENVARFEVK